MKVQPNIKALGLVVSYKNILLSFRELFLATGP